MDTIHKLCDVRVTTASIHIIHLKAEERSLVMSLSSESLHCSCEHTCTCQVISFIPSSTASLWAAMMATYWVRFYISSPNVPHDDVSRIISQYYVNTPQRVKMKCDSTVWYHLIKVLLVGNPAVGKTNLMMRFFNNSYSDDSPTTTGLDNKLKFVDMHDTMIRLQIWDGAGHKRYRPVITPYYRGAAALLLVYDMTDEESISSIAEWTDLIDRHAQDSASRILIGNKCDLVDNPWLAAQRGEALAEKYGMTFFAVSAKSDINVLEMFTSIVEDIAGTNPTSRIRKFKRENADKKKCVVL